jgi:trans-2,3-dihydro-3-hydroxyanthranilate isomerase
MAHVRIPFRMVDVFTDRPFAGNPLCVIPEPVDASVDLMQAIAREVGFSETTFVTSFGRDRYAMRIFTPDHELPFAGHPSLGTAFVMVSEGRVTSPLTQVVEAGEFAITVDVEDGSARMRQQAPAFGDVLDAAGRAALASAVGLSEADLVPDLPVQVVSTGLGHLTLPVGDPAAVVRASPDRDALTPLLRAVDSDAVYVFALVEASASGSHAKARLFAPVAGVEEDPATGSAAGPLGAYLVHHGVIPPGRLTIAQGVEMGRPSTLIVDVEPDAGTLAVSVEGGVRSVADGWFDLPAEAAGTAREDRS